MINNNGGCGRGERKVVFWVRDVEMGGYRYRSGGGCVEKIFECCSVKCGIEMRGGHRVQDGEAMRCFSPF